MRHSRQMTLAAMGSILLAALLASSLMAGNDVVYRGVDLFRTPSNGSTYSDYRNDPIPAGFFCAASKAFTGRIEFEGVPVTTSPPGVFGEADTLVERLDDAVFDKTGKAETRVQVRAMYFASLQPIQTECGLFDVSVALDGEQPITLMRIFRESKEGGRFLAPISVHIKMNFTPLGFSADPGLPDDRPVSAPH